MKNIGEFSGFCKDLFDFLIFFSNTSKSQLDIYVDLEKCCKIHRLPGITYGFDTAENESSKVCPTERPTDGREPRPAVLRLEQVGVRGDLAAWVGSRHVTAYSVQVYLYFEYRYTDT